MVANVSLACYFHSPGNKMWSLACCKC